MDLSSESLFKKNFGRRILMKKNKKEKSDWINDYLENSNESLDADFTHRVMSQINVSSNKKRKLDRKIVFFPVILPVFSCFLLALFLTPLDFIEKTDSEATDLKNSEEQIVEDILLISDDLPVSEEFIYSKAYELLVLLDT